MLLVLVLTHKVFLRLSRFFEPANAAALHRSRPLGALKKRTPKAARSEKEVSRTPEGGVWGWGLPYKRGGDARQKF